MVARTFELSNLWAYRYTGDNRTVDVHISRLRRKLPSLGEWFVTIKNVGYRLDEPAERRVAASS